MNFDSVSSGSHGLAFVGVVQWGLNSDLWFGFLL